MYWLLKCKNCAITQFFEELELNEWTMQQSIIRKCDSEKLTGSFEGARTHFLSARIFELYGNPRREIKSIRFQLVFLR